MEVAFCESEAQEEVRVLFASVRVLELQATPGQNSSPRYVFNAGTTEEPLPAVLKAVRASLK